MAELTTHAPLRPRPPAPDRHPTKEAVPLALSTFAVRRPASTGHGRPGTWAASPTIP
jgi:hypothetical protein